MKKRRWRVFSAGALAIALIAVPVWWLTLPRPQISLAVYRQLHTGMSLTEIEQIVKASPGDYSTGLRSFNQIVCGYAFTESELISVKGRLLSLPEMQENTPNDKFVAWWGRNRALIVSLDEHGAAKVITYARRTAPSDEWLGRIRFWIESRFEEGD